MNVADAFPARQQSDGTVWFRGVDHDGSLGDGWTSNPAYAHPDYDVKIGDDGSAVTWRGDPWGPSTSPVQLPKWEGVDDLPDITIDGKRLDWPDVMKQPIEGVQLPTEIEWTITDSPDTPPVDERITIMPGTSLTEDLDIAPRYTKWMRFLLPPAPPRAEVKHGQWGWYRLPAPTTGRPTGFPRATTIADTLDNQYGLNLWKRRETARRVLELSQMKPDTLLNEFYEVTAADALEALTKSLDQNPGDIDDALDVIDNLMGGAEARELGECAHAWIEALALGMVLLKDVPDVVKPHVHYAREVMKRFGIVAEARYVERVILNDRGDETIAGRIDCIWRILATNERVLGDVKTGKSLKYGWLPFGVQVGGVYGWATRILAADGKSWERMPKLVGVPHPDDHDDDCPQRENLELWPGDICDYCQASGDSRAPYAILLHVPSDQPEHASAVTIDLNWGAEVLMESLSARSRQKEASREVPKHVIPAPTDAALRYVEARMALTEIDTPDDGQAVYESFQDVWDDDLDEFAAAVASLL